MLRHMPFDVDWWRKLAFAVIVGCGMALAFTSTADNPDWTELWGFVRGICGIVGVGIVTPFAKPYLESMQMRIRAWRLEHLPSVNIDPLDKCPVCGQSIGESE